METWFVVLSTQASDTVGSMKREKRRWTTTLAEPIPAGPQGQPAHAAGAQVAVTHLVFLPEAGAVSMTVPRPSVLLLEAAEAHAKRATRLRKQLPNQTKHGRWVQPGHELHFSNEELVYDYFQDAMAAVLLLHTALDNFANELLPENVVLNDSAGNPVDRAQIESTWGLRRRLDLVLPAVTGKASLQVAQPSAWASLMVLKDLRDDIGHIHREASFTRPDEDLNSSIFSRLLAQDLIALLKVTEEAMEYYG